MVEHVRETLSPDRISERRACRVLGQPRSTQRRTRHVPEDEPRLVRRIIDLATRYGYRRITMMLREEGWKVNHKRIERLWRQGLGSSRSVTGCGLQTDRAFGFVRSIGTMYGATTSCSAGLMMDDRFGC